MIKWALRRAIDKFEREWKYDVSVRLTTSPHLSGSLELSQSFVAELIPNVAQEVASPGFGIEKFPILRLGEVEVAINLAAPETQVQSCFPAS